jgi:hypothetical protein
MNYVFLVGLVCSCTLAAQPAPGTGSIEGHVFNLLTGAPVRKATVELQATQIRLSADTDAEGRFQFTALPAGSFSLSAKHPGFLDRVVRRPMAIGQDGHVTDVEIRLPPLSAVSGRILDEDGDPVGGARVTIFRQVYRDGRKQWAGPVPTLWRVIPANTAVRVSRGAATWSKPERIGRPSTAGMAAAMICPTNPNCATFRPSIRTRPASRRRRP